MTELTSGQTTRRRRDTLSKAQIVETAIELLDAQGEKALTFRALMTHLATGAGALYWHVADKDELLVAAADRVIALALEKQVTEGQSPLKVIRSMALAVFDCIETHPWLGAQLTREPWQLGVLRLLEGFGQQLQVVGVPQEQQFNAVSVLLHYLLGLAGQYAAGARLSAEVERSDFLTDIAARWASLDPAEYPFVHQAAAQLPHHDDREQFLAGLALILRGILPAGTEQP